MGLHSTAPRIAAELDRAAARRRAGEPERPRPFNGIATTPEQLRVARQAVIDCLRALDSRLKALPFVTEIHVGGSLGRNGVARWGFVPGSFDMRQAEEWERHKLGAPLTEGGWPSDFDLGYGFQPGVSDAQRAVAERVLGEIFDEFGIPFHHSGGGGPTAKELADTLERTEPDIDAFVAKVRHFEQGRRSYHQPVDPVDLSAFEA